MELTNFLQFATPFFYKMLLSNTGESLVSILVNVPSSLTLFEPHTTKVA